MRTTTEEWREIKNYPNYEVSNLGRVRNRITGQEIKPFVNQGAFNEYLRVQLYRNGEPRHFYVHRLVASAFCERRHYTRNQVHHIDRNTFNNSHTNLAWLTPMQNNPAYAEHAGDLPF